MARRKSSKGGLGVLSIFAMVALALFASSPVAAILVIAAGILIFAIIRTRKMPNEFEKPATQEIKVKTIYEKPSLEQMMEYGDKELEAKHSAIAKTEKLLQSAEKKLQTITGLYKSIVYALDIYRLPDTTEAEVRKVLERFDNSELPQTPDLKCLTVKSLRKLFLDNEKNIQRLTKEYEERYSTKSLATIYKLMVMAMSAEMKIILQDLQHGKQEEAVEKVREMTAKYLLIATEGNQTIVNTLGRFIGQLEGLYIESVRIEHEYYVQRERAREEQRAIRDQMRQEAEERKRLEEERKRVEAEEKKYKQEMARVQDQLNDSTEESELEMLRKRLAELTAQMENVEAKREEIINLQNGKAGTVYIISNVGSFGDQVFKIGMTRRLEPQDRVNELGDASVPFPFDVHSFIFSGDAVALETELHHRLNDRRVNKVNRRKEFFRVSLDELEALVAGIDPSAPFERTMMADQFYQSQETEAPVSELIDLSEATQEQ